MVTGEEQQFTITINTITDIDTWLILDYYWFMSHQIIIFFFFANVPDNTNGDTSINDKIIIDYSTRDIWIITILHTTLCINIKEYSVTILIHNNIMKSSLKSLDKEMYNILTVLQLVIVHLIELYLLQNSMHVLKYSMLTIIMTLVMTIMILMLYGTRINIIIHPYGYHRLWWPQ